ncbi:uncharacterized protein LOC144611043 isoform X2 [Rhinoraja longicauda]
MSPGEMRVLLLFLGSLTADSTLGDPCVNHTVLDQPWRSSGCHRTWCSGRWMDDRNLKKGWYRFSSYDNVKIPESAVPFYRCSGWRPGWLNGAHPTKQEGEVKREVCFNWFNNNYKLDTCLEHQEITIKNCDSYFVYYLKRTPRSNSVYCADSARSDPCVKHTVLDQPWRSTGCSNTQCTSGQWKSDKLLVEEWYRFNSSGGRKIPETAVPAHHCSGKCPGWLNGSHPRAGDGEVTRMVCFNESGGSGDVDTKTGGSGLGNGCSNNLDIKVKNCSSYFVYQLKPTASDETVYCTAADSALGDPCVNHTVLHQPWRSTGCSNTECNSGNLMNDDNLHEGWYRFKSSGGWKIPETVVPKHHCSASSPGWLNGAHPSMRDGEVIRRVCLNWESNHCHKQLEIKVKHCKGFFVYRLVPMGCCKNVYCTDPASVPTEEPQETTPEPREDLSTVPEPDTSSDPASVPTEEPQETTPEPQEDLSTVPEPDTSSDQASVPTEEPQETTAEPQEDLSTVPETDARSDPASVPTEEPQETIPEPREDLSTLSDPDTSSASVPTEEPQETPGPREDLSTVPESDTSSDLPMSTGEQNHGSLTGESTQEPSSAPVGDTSSGLQMSTGEQTRGSLTGESTQEPSSVPVGDTSSDPASVPTEEPQETTPEPREDFPIIREQDTHSDEDNQWIEIKVTVEGEMSEDEVMEALRAKLMEMYDDPDPEIERVP